jgi:hypothetical protein
MSAVQKRLARLKAIRTELQSLDLDVAADAVGEEIASLEALPTGNPAGAEFLGVVLALTRPVLYPPWSTAQAVRITPTSVAMVMTQVSG